MSDQTPQPATPAPPSGGIGFFLICCLGCASFLAGWMLLTRSSDSATESHAARIVVIDSNRIIDAKVKEIMGQPSYTPGQAKTDAERVVAALDAVLAEYRKNGVVVLNSRAALAWPNQVDVTHEVAQRIGIRLE